MTEGIIQKVCGKYGYGTPFIKEIEQELISEITKDCKYRGNANFITVYDLIGVSYEKWSKLIGDTE